MSSSLLTPDLRRILDDLARRLRVLEQRITSRTAAPTAPDVSPYAHPGTGENSIVLEPAGGGSVAAGFDTVAAGHQASAASDYAAAFGAHSSAAENSTAVGTSAAANTSWSTAIGVSSVAAQNGVAIGGGATASHINSVAVGYNAQTTAAAQINMGTRHAIIGAPNSWSSDADLIPGQVVFYLDEGADTLVVRAKYGDSTVKTGTVSLA